MSALAAKRPRVKKVQNAGSYRYVGALGCRYDADTGLTYMRQRWYSGAEAGGIQRFVSRDPLHTGNRYKYAANNAVRYVDPSGMAPTNPYAGTNIVIYSPGGSVGPIDIASIQQTASRYGFGEVTFKTNLSGHDPNFRGYDASTNTLILRMESMNKVVSVPNEDPTRHPHIMTGESPTGKPGYFWISPAGINQLIDWYGSECPGLSRQQMLTNKLTFAIKHEIFNHQLGVLTQGRPYTWDDYTEIGTLNSGNDDTYYDSSNVYLSSGAPFSLWRLQHGLPAVPYGYNGPR